MATQTEYLHCSMGGSYWINCEIVEDDGEEYVVRYHDYIIDEYVETTVTDRSMVREVAIDITEDQVTLAHNDLLVGLQRRFPQLPAAQLQTIGDDILDCLKLHLL